MLKYLILMFFLFTNFLFSSKVIPEIKETPEEYLNSAILIIKDNALNTAKIDWKKATEEAIISIKFAKNTEDTYPVIKELLRKLKDNHSFFRNPKQYKKNKFSKVEDNKPVVSKLLPSKIGYIKIPAIKGYTDEENLRHAQIIQDNIAAVDSLKPRGWIIDLRENTGGNMWPMMAGLGPLLGEGTLGSMNFSDEKHSWFYRNGKIGFDDIVLITLPDSGYVLKAKKFPLAVITGKRTMSSGEAVVIAFKGLENVTIFGQPTKGLSTVNVSHKLSDGAQIVLTEGIFADRTGKEYGKKIIPDVIIADYKNKEKIIQKVEKWILNKLAEK